MLWEGAGQLEKCAVPTFCVTPRKFALLTDAPQMDMLKYGRVII